ncbi:flavin-containing monooxygenase [Sphingopyxis lindanitolerans]|uniref:flavin-containing monooxygenase n=1 Tax=Sphingopyxis lindanitolerans TaxID=2054227 RepID=UPI001F5BBD8E|nr:NAD(P)/FAD-dependent oxidoreductase [Sphingopyxis lindanitolerans]
MSPSIEHIDVLIVGAGISGIGAAYELKQQCPGKSFLMLDAFESFGGTWHWHTYPGIRSDSDLFTFGYRFKPWLGAPIATRDEILKYLGEVIEEAELTPHIRYGHRIRSAAWSSDDARWIVEADHGGKTVRLSCNFLWMCQGYYRHAEGYTPDWEGMENFGGEIVHPQTWPEDLDLSGKRVVVIGSGATAATIVPAIAGTCAHVTMLQRSPSYFASDMNRNRLADTLREIDVDPQTVHEIVRRRITHDQRQFLGRALGEPETVKGELLDGLEKFLPRATIDEHFTPRYRPWQQRIAVAPGGDLFKAIGSGAASVVTDHIDRFTPTGIRLASGDELEADVVITATGFSLCVLGDIRFSIDGAPLNFADCVNYRGMMFTGVPNMAWIFGYFRAASWTLRVDLVADFVCRLLQQMDAIDARKVMVALRDEDADMPLLPWIDGETFNPGYLMRDVHLLPRRGDKPEWTHSQDYWWEKDALPQVDLDDDAFVYETEADARAGKAA